MKRLNNLYSSTYELDNIIEMTNKVLKNVRNKKAVDKFESYKMEHILNIKYRLETGNNIIGKYNIFLIRDPKYRIIMSLSIEDKIINHLVSKYILEKTFENKFIDSMVATRTGKGTSYGIKLFRKYLNKMKRKYNNFYVLKIDINKYFYNIDHEVLKRILNEKIKDEKSLKVLYSIIDSTNEIYVNEKIRFIKENNDNLSEIPLYKNGKGVGIGNQTSQNFGLIYLYELNHYIKEKLKIKYLINYMDDFVIIHHDKEYLKYCLKIIEKKLNTEHKLKINKKKTNIYNIRNGVEFLGYRFLVLNNKIYIKIKKDTKRRFKKKVKCLNVLKTNNYINNRNYWILLSSYKGLLKYRDCKRLFLKQMYFWKQKKKLMLQLLVQHSY